MTNFVIDSARPMPVFEQRLLYQALAFPPVQPPPPPGPVVMVSNNSAMPTFEWRLLYQAQSVYPVVTTSGKLTTVILNALETKDTFLGGISFWNRVLSGEIGIIESAFTGAEIGVVEQAASAGTSGLIEPITVPVSGAPVTVVTAAHVSIRII